MKTIELKVDGLCCSDCALKVEKVLKPARGIKDLKILMAAEKAVITYNEEEVTLEDIIKRIEGIGHKAVLFTIPSPLREGKGQRDLADTLRFLFITAIGVIALGEIGFEYFGVLEKGILLL